MRLVIGGILLVVGLVILVLGINASESFASDVSKFFTGNPTDRAIWLMLLGTGAVVGGGVMVFLGTRGARNS